MIKLSEFNRSHIVGLSALALIIGGLGVVGNMNSGARHIAALPDLGGVQTAQSDDSGSDFLANLKRLPANAFGSAKSLLPGQPSTDASQSEAQSPASESKFWSDQEWRLASKAVADFRSSGKSQAREKSEVKDMSALSWRPPEEIAGKAPGRSQ